MNWMLIVEIAIGTVTGWILVLAVYAAVGPYLAMYLMGRMFNVTDRLDPELSDQETVPEGERS